MSEPIISVSGLRGIIGESLTPDVAVRYAAAFAELAPVGPIVVTRDGRATGEMVAELVCGALLAMGRDVIDAGVAATPTTGVLVRDRQAAGGIQISASHNPAEYNGLKLFSADGRIISAIDGNLVIERYRSGTFHWRSHDKLGRRLACEDSTSRHLELVLETVNVERIRKRGFHVLLDANHGAGGVLGRRLLEALGCRVTVLGGEADGQFEHPPEPTAENLATVLDKVGTAGAVVGFCQDPDADRLAVIDETGRYLGEEYTLAMCVNHVLRQESGAVVTNCSTSRMAEDVALNHKMPFQRSAVGEANVVETMLAYDAVIGGEGNGGVIDPRVGFVRDSFAGMALLLDAMAARDAKISQLADELPRYAIVKRKFDLPADKTHAALGALAQAFPDAEHDATDGLRLDWPGKWLLVRPSNTEPIIRAIAEASTEEEANALCDAAAKALAKA